MSKAESRALEAYPKLSVASVCLDGTSPVDLNTGARKRFIEGYEQAEKDTIAEAEKWLRANFHHRNCWSVDEFCISLRTYFGIKK